MITHVRRVVEPQVAVKSGDGLDLVGAEVEAADVKVLRKTVLVVALGDDGNATLGGPSEENLGGGLAVLVGNGLDALDLEESLGVLGQTELDERLGSERRVGGDGDVERLAELDEGLLCQVRVVLDLEGGGDGLGVAQEVKDQGTVVVGDTDVLGQALGVDLLHGLPGLGEAGLAGLHLAVVVEPAGRVAVGGVNVLESDGEVHDVEVKVVDAVVLELLLADGLDVLLVVEGVPELGDDEQLLTLDDAFLDGAGNTLASLLLVAVVYEINQYCGGYCSMILCLTASAVKESVSGLDGVVDNVRAGVIVDLPETETNQRHLRMSVSQFAALQWQVSHTWWPVLSLAVGETIVEA